jgi:DNA-binding phage protein
MIYMSKHYNIMKEFRSIISMFNNRKLAEAAGVKKPVIGKMLRYSHNPSIKTVEKILKAARYQFKIIDESGNELVMFNDGCIIQEVRALTKGSVCCIAEKTGLKPTAVYLWFNGRHTPSIINFQAYVNAAGYQLVIGGIR